MAPAPECGPSSPPTRHVLTGPTGEPAGFIAIGGDLWYVALRLDASYRHAVEYDLDLVLVNAGDDRQERLAERIATPSGILLWFGPGLGPRSWGLGSDGSDALYVVGGLPRGLLVPPVRVLAVDRVRSDDDVVAEASITARDMAGWT